MSGYGQKWSENDRRWSEDDQEISEKGPKWSGSGPTWTVQDGQEKFRKCQVRYGQKMPKNGIKCPGNCAIDQYCSSVQNDPIWSKMV